MDDLIPMSMLDPKEMERMRRRRKIEIARQMLLARLLGIKDPQQTGMMFGVDAMPTEDYGYQGGMKMPWMTGTRG